jgi:hypothetical protein
MTLIQTSEWQEARLATFNSEWPKELHETLKNSTFLLNELDKILAKRLERLELEETKTSIYEQPSLIEKLIFINGQKKQLRDLRSLLTTK